MELRSTPSHERRRVGLKAERPPINPDFDGSTVYLYIACRGITFFTSVTVNYLFRLKSKYPQYRPLEGVSPFDGGHCWHAPDGIDEDKAVRHIKVRLALNRFECLRARNGCGSKEWMPGNDGDHTTIDIKANIPRNSRHLCKRGSERS